MRWRGFGSLLTSIHASVEELDLGHLDGLASGFGQTVALVVSFGGIDRIYLCDCISIFLVLRCDKGQLTQAQETRPQRPPAMATGKGEVDVEPWKVASSCLPLS